jgi:hypothetical protein
VAEAERKDIHLLCIDRVVEFEHKEHAAHLAVRENERNRPDLKKPYGVSMYPLKLALFTGKMWRDGKKLGVRFVDGTPQMRQKARQFAQEWCQYANITFNFNARSNADIRISFTADSGSWSAVGTDCLVRPVFPADQPTMNFGWLREDTPDLEWRRVVVHEFGHALGAIHEHQNPSGGIKWNVEKVYKYFSGPPNNWTKAEIDRNILGKYSIDQLNATKFDPYSIMLYQFPGDLIVGGHGTRLNTTLSAGDKRFIRKMYPKA